MKRILFVALAAAFLFLGFQTYLQSRPEAKNRRIYQAVHACSPYYLEKRFGGLQIRSKTDEAFKEKPTNAEVFHRLDALEKRWAQQHLSRQGDALSIRDANGTVCKTLHLKTEAERRFVRTFYGLKP